MIIKAVDLPTETEKLQLFCGDHFFTPLSSVLSSDLLSRVSMVKMCLVKFLS